MGGRFAASFSFEQINLWENCIYLSAIFMRYAESPFFPVELNKYKKQFLCIMTND